MEDEQINALMKYVRGEISFTEWIESGAVTADKEQDDENEVEMQDGDNEVEQDWDFATQEAQDDVSEELKTTGGRLKCMNLIYKLSMSTFNDKDHHNRHRHHYHHRHHLCQYHYYHVFHCENKCK